MEDELWFNCLLKWHDSIIFGVLLEKLQQLSLIILPPADAWYYNIAAIASSNWIMADHPELVFFCNNFIKSNVFLSISNIFIAINQYFIPENFTFIFSAVLNLIILIMLIVFFVLIFFSVFGNPEDEESSIDQEYLTVSLTVESEEELGSIDDILLGLIIFTYAFLWYFYLNCWQILSVVPEMVIMFYLFPLMFYIIILVPTLILLDFGLYFVTYLRGSGTTPTISMELLYDYIALSAFYVRLLVQGVRLLLMMFVFGSLNEFILNIQIKLAYLPLQEFNGEFTNNIEMFFKFISYCFLIKLPAMFFYWLYEVFHTLFVLSMQFSAFFAMIFWLFLFLFTTFYADLNENYFFFKRLSFEKKY